jgi:hypothetical protein
MRKGKMVAGAHVTEANRYQFHWWADGRRSLVIPLEENDSVGA